MRLKGIPGNLVTHFFPVFPFNVAFGHQRSGDTWLPSCNGSHVRSEKLRTDEHAPMPSISIHVLCNFLSRYTFSLLSSSLCLCLFKPLCSELFMSLFHLLCCLDVWCRSQCFGQCSKLSSNLVLITVP